MVQFKRTWLLISLLTVVVVGLNCSCNGVKLCCNEGKGDFSSDERSYCLDHAVAARLYIQKPDDPAEQQQRLDDFKKFFEGVKACATVECIEIAVDTTTVVPEFNPIFDAEHGDAENDLNIDQDQKPGLIICGFEHAIATGIPE